LQESEKKFKDLSILFRSISDNMMDMLWAKDLNKHYIFANKSVCENLLFAKDTEEPIGKDDLFFASRQRAMHSENRDWHTFGEICMDSDQAVLDAGKPQKFDEFGNVEGKFLFLDVRKSPLYNLHGELIGTVGSAQDRTAEREMSKQLAQRERELSTLVSNLPGMVYRSLDGYDGRMFFVSDGCLNVTGYTKEEFLEKKSVLFNDLILETHRDTVVERWQRVLNRGEMFEGEYPIRTCSGEVKWVWERCRGEYNEEGGLQYVEGYIEDVTERKIATESLKESEQRYETFINSINDFAFLKDENFRYLFINEANAKFFGKKTAEVIGMDDFALMRHDYATVCRANDILAVNSSQVLISEEIIDGRIYETRKFPVALSEGRTGVGGYIRDISDRKAAEIEINKLNDELEQRVLDRTAQLEAANKELEAFSYSVSHDLRAPLRALDGFTKILFEEYRESFNDEGKRICTIIQENAQRMGQLIDDLLALSRLNRQDLHLARIDMKNLAGLVFDETVSDAEKAKIDFRINDLHMVMGDRVALKQVLVNLIGNAVKFSSKREKAVITITSEEHKDMAVYCVKDNGAGFDMKYSDKLFGAFQRLHSVKEFEGNGIGLAIVQRIVHRHGGSVWAEAKVDLGASFYFSLPLKVEKQH
jgi:PAS domain S-box-containing protein